MRYRQGKERRHASVGRLSPPCKVYRAVKTLRVLCTHPKRKKKHRTLSLTNLY